MALIATGRREVRSRISYILKASMLAFTCWTTSILVKTTRPKLYVKEQHFEKEDNQLNEGEKVMIFMCIDHPSESKMWPEVFTVSGVRYIDRWRHDRDPTFEYCIEDAKGQGLLHPRTCEEAWWYDAGGRPEY
jgi:hypothetical protein